MFFKDHSTVLMNQNTFCHTGFVVVVFNSLSPQSDVFEKPLLISWDTQAHSQANLPSDERYQPDF